MLEDIRKRFEDWNKSTAFDGEEIYETLLDNAPKDIKFLLSLIDKYKTFVDAFPTLQHNMSLLADDKGNVKWSMLSAMMDGYLEGFEQMK